MNIAHAAALAAAIEALSLGHARLLATELRTILESVSAVVAEPVQNTPNGSRRTRHSLQLLVIARDGLVCQICHRAVALDGIHFDHIIPWSRGGQSTLENVRVTCGPCNIKRGDAEVSHPLRKHADRTAAARMRRFRMRQKLRTFESLQLDLSGPGFGVTEGRNGPASSSSLKISGSEEEDRTTVTHDTPLDDQLRAVATQVLADRGLEVPVALVWTAFRLHHHGTTFKRSRLVAAWGRWLLHERPPKVPRPTLEVVRTARGMSPPVRDAPSEPLPRAELHRRLVTLAAGIA